MCQEIGKAVGFYDYDERGEWKRFEAVVIRSFVEPPEEDPLGRLNYVVRTTAGVITDVYAHECFAL